MRQTPRPTTPRSHSPFISAAWLLLGTVACISFVLITLSLRFEYIPSPSENMTLLKRIDRWTGDVQLWTPDQGWVLLSNKGNYKGLY